MHAPFEFQFFLDDGHQDIDAHGYPNLCLHRIFRGSKKRLDSQMLFDPLKEQLDLPATLVQSGNRQCVQHKIVGQEHQTLACVLIHILDTSKRLGIFLSSFGSCESDGLITTEACRFIDVAIPHPAELKIFLRG